MSGYKIDPLEFDGLRTIPLIARGGKVRVEDFASPYEKGQGVAALLNSLPHILAGDSLRRVVACIAASRLAGKPVVWGLGGHVIKCGLAPVLISLARGGFATAFAMNGAAAIHDFEIALAGATSEDVEAVLPDGRFGVAEETGREFNRAVRQAAAANIGLGEQLGRSLETLAPPHLAPASLLSEVWKLRIPVTVHVAIGTDTPHAHPEASGEAFGKASHRDFRLFCALVRDLNAGGVYINAGSAVVLPEVFLKAVSVVRNLGHPLRDFATVNLDFLSHYRPRVNVVERPHAGAGGRGFSLVGHHEILIPLLAAALAESCS
jgi:hypothetical protein